MYIIRLKFLFIFSFHFVAVFHFYYLETTTTKSVHKYQNHFVFYFKKQIYVNEKETFFLDLIVVCVSE